MSRLAISWLAIAVIAGVACHDNPNTPPAFVIEKAPTNNGDQQRDTVLATLAPLRVLVRADGQPVRDMAVYWRVVGSGITAAPMTTTDASGIASLPLTLGATAADYTVQAALGVTTNAPHVTFLITADPGRPATLRVISGLNQSDTTMAQLGADYVVQVIDGHGNGVAGAAIDWAVAAGGGSISPARSVTTLPSGLATARHTLGPSAGEQTATARAEALPSSPEATFKSIAQLPPPPPADGYLPLAVEMTAAGNTDVYRVNANGTGLTRLTTSAAVDGSPVWSPDGARIAFVSNRTGHGEIWVMNADGSDQVQLTTNAGASSIVGLTSNLASGPVWSTDGARIAFASVRDSVGGGINIDIYVVNADGSDQRRLTTAGGPDYQPSWSPDSRTIAFVSKRSGRQEIFVMNADGTGQTRLVSIATESWHPVWSPDGLRIAFTSQAEGYYTVPDVYVVNADGGGLRRLVAGGADATWSTDGSKVAFTSVSTCPYYYYYYYQCGWDVAVINADGTGMTHLTAGRPLHAGAWSPNGQWITVTETTCGAGGCLDAVKVVRKDGTGFRNLATASSASWKP